MNVNSTKLSNSKGPSTVVSKYFSSNRVMDDSLTDFKEKKSATKGPKTIQKTGSSKLKRKAGKQIKGQKDIRTALKGNQSELVDYTKQFDNVCKLSGLDVETEQLLLAVALSKSLQKTDHTTDNTPCTSQSSQGRISKIRTTLQEYGFTVPEIKISKKSRASRKNYKLLLSTENEKQQIISDKYAQVLFDLCNYKFKDGDQLNDSNLYYKATNISYMDIKDNNVFYVDHLVEKSTSTGSLLRSWTDIPGRPSSPISCDNLNMDFSEIECSQEELDIILSGSLKSIKSIMRNKASKKSITAPVTIIVDDEYNNVKYDLNDKNCSQNQNSEAILSKDRNSFSKENESITPNQRSSTTSFNSSVIDKNSLATHSIIRSCSPDIFDDEASGILENYEENKDIVYTQIIDSIIEDKNKSFHSIDLTQNTNDVTTKTLKCSQNNNFTRRHSNDVMEITECVGTSVLSKINVNAKKSPGIYLSNSLTQQFQISNETKILNDNMEITDCVANNSKLSENVPVKSNIDLTQDSDGENEITVSECHNNVSNISHTSNSDDDLPSIDVKSGNNESLDATIILNNDEIDSALRRRPQGATFDNYQNKTSYRQALKNLKSASKKVAEAEESEASQRFFDEFEHDHSDDTVEKNEKSKSVEYEVCGKDKNNIDLTQSSDDANECLSEKEFNAIDFDQRSLGKRDEVSIDYDELCDNVLHKGENVLSDACSISQQLVATIINDDSNLSNSKSTSGTYSNQNSVVFEICDQELNYSINKSRCEVPWDNFGGISIMNDVSKSENSTNPAIDVKTNASESSTLMSKSMSDSFLPMVAIKSTTAGDVHKEKIPISTPLHSCSKTKKDSAKTPVSLLSSEYIIKTDQVTPISDYASMSTPERNRELDKYGLKPFKRKRAVQILTHLYNQTHPLVESSDDRSSPSKRRKHDQKSPRRNHDKKSPRKCLSSPKKNLPVCDKENNLYGVTKELPDILAIECLEEDWVFQKREKAKIHSCRVPLHIALHNYVSCRRLLREAILRYEPVNIDDIHKGLVAIGFRYDPKDLLKFMDKKCITVKTADNNARNNKR